MSRPLVFLFPGQTARDARMFARLAAIDCDAACRATAALEARGVRPDALDDNRAVQLAVYAATRAWAAVAAREGLAATASAGHSLGEYAHLVHAGALGEDAGWALIDARGAAYDAGPDGAMAAIPLPAEELPDALAGAPVWLACDNAPGQVVIGGAEADVLAALQRLEEERFVLGTVIERRVPMHTPRFAPVVEAFLPALEAAPWRPVPLAWSGVLGRAVPDPDRATIVRLLARHVCEPVRWRGLVEALLDRHPDAVFLEVGPRRVLTDLFRRWAPGVPAFAMDPCGTDAIEARFDATMEEVRRAVG